MSAVDASRTHCSSSGSHECGEHEGPHTHVVVLSGGQGGGGGKK